MIAWHGRGQAFEQEINTPHKKLPVELTNSSIKVVTR